MRSTFHSIRVIVGITLFCALLGFSAGCRMCGSTYDYCGPTYTGDPWDPAGDPMYRAGSVLSPTNGEGINLFADDDCIDCKKGSSGAGITPIKRGGTPTKASSSGQSGQRIAIPPTAPNGFGGASGDMIYESSAPNEYTIPPVERPWQSPDNLPRPEPIWPGSGPAEPIQPGATPQPEPRRPGTTQSRPYGNLNENADFSITLEELQREDPSITNVKIIGVEEKNDTATKPAVSPWK